jgi:hypothetical protein
VFRPREPIGTSVRPLIPWGSPLYTDCVSTLIAYRNGIEFFRSSGSWLYPLLDLEQVLGASHRQNEPGSSLTTYDKVVGRAGALLSIRLGITAIRTDVVSELALETLAAHGVVINALEVTPRILCATEDLLRDVSDPEQAHRLILARIEALRK